MRVFGAYSVEDVFLGFFFSIGIILLIYMIAAIIVPCFSPSFYLKKNEWSCSKFQDYTAIEPVLAGKIIVNSPVHHHDCIQWSHL